MVVASALLLITMAHAVPSLTVFVPDAPLHPGQTYEVTCRVSWEGPADSYTLLPPQADDVEWAGLTAHSGLSRVEDGRNVVTFTMTLTPRAEGEYELPEVRVPYMDEAFRTRLAERPVAAGDDEAFEDPEPPVLAARPGTVIVTPDRRWVWRAGGFVLAGALVAAHLGYRQWKRRRAHETLGPGEASPLTRARNALHEARRKRLDSDFYGFYQCLVAAAETLSGGGLALEALRARARDAGYGGRRPTDDEMDTDLRAVERAIRHIQEEGTR